MAPLWHIHGAIGSHLLTPCAPSTGGATPRAARPDEVSGRAALVERVVGPPAELAAVAAVAAYFESRLKTDFDQK